MSAPASGQEADNNEDLPEEVAPAFQWECIATTPEGRVLELEEALQAKHADLVAVTAHRDKLRKMAGDWMVKATVCDGQRIAAEKSLENLKMGEDSRVERIIAQKEAELQKKIQFYKEADNARIEAVKQLNDFKKAEQSRIEAITAEFDAKFQEKMTFYQEAENGRIEAVKQLNDFKRADRRIEGITAEFDAKSQEKMKFYQEAENARIEAVKQLNDFKKSEQSRIDEIVTAKNAALKEKNDLYQEVHKEAMTNQTKAETATLKANALQVQLNSTQRELTSSKDKCHELDGQLTTSNNKCEGLEGEVTLLESELQKAKNRVLELRSLFSTTQKSVHELDKKWKKEDDKDEDGQQGGSKRNRDGNKDQAKQEGASGSRQSGGAPSTSASSSGQHHTAAVPRDTENDAVNPEVNRSAVVEGQTHTASLEGAALPAESDEATPLVTKEAKKEFPAPMKQVKPSEDNCVHLSDGDDGDEAVSPTASPSTVLLRDAVGNNITFEDFHGVEEGGMLNDTLADYYLNVIMREHAAPEVRAAAHVLSCFFYKRLTAKMVDGDFEVGAINANNRFNKVHANYCAFSSKYTKGFDIFSKNLIVLPVIEKRHWYLIMILNPSACIVKGSVHRDALLKNFNVDEAIPVKSHMIIFDSLNCFNNKRRDSAIDFVRDFLELEFNNKKATLRGNEGRIFDRSKLGLLKPVGLPQQSSQTTDCGYFMLKYARTFLAKPPPRERLLKPFVWSDAYYCFIDVDDMRHEVCRALKSNASPETLDSYKAWKAQRPVDLEVIEVAGEEATGHRRAFKRINESKADEPVSKREHASPVRGTFKGRGARGNRGAARGTIY